MELTRPVKARPCTRVFGTVGGCSTIQTDERPATEMVEPYPWDAYAVEKRARSLILREDWPEEATS